MSNASPWFKFYPAMFFSDIIGMDAIEIKNYIIGISRAWVNCDFDNMTSWQVEQYLSMMESNNSRSAKLKAIWEFRTKPSSGLIDVYNTSISGLIDNNSGTLDAHLMSSNISNTNTNTNTEVSNGRHVDVYKANTAKPHKIFPPESMPYRIARSMDATLAINIGEAWKPRTESEIQSWADDIEKMHRLDRIKYSKIWGWFEAASNHHFWKTNIKCPAKLRKQIKSDNLTELYSDAEEYAYLPYDEEPNEPVD